MVAAPARQHFSRIRSWPGQAWKIGRFRLPLCFALSIERRANPARKSVDDRVAATLGDAGQPRPFADLRALCRVHAASLYERLAAMTSTGRIIKSGDGYHLAR